MKKYILSALVILCAMLVGVSCQQKPQKRDLDRLEEIKRQEEAESVTEATTDSEVQEEAPEEAPEEEPIDDLSDIPDDYVYTGDELTDELIQRVLIGYWEFDDFGYSGGYNFFESGFLQLIMKHEVEQTGIYVLRNHGIYFSLDSKTWDEDVLIIHSVSKNEIVGSFGENYLTLVRSDPALIKENSGVFENSESGGSIIVDVAGEASSGVSA